MNSIDKNLKDYLFIFDDGTHYIATGFENLNMAIYDCYTYYFSQSNILRKMCIATQPVFKIEELIEYYNNNVYSCNDKIKKIYIVGQCVYDINISNQPISNQIT